MATPKTASPVDAIHTLREQIVATKNDIESIACAPLPAAEAERNLVEHVEQLGAAYDPSGLLVDYAREPAPSFDVVLGMLPAAHDDPRIRVAFLAAILRDALLAQWLPRLRARYEHDPGLAQAIPLAERPTRLRRLHERLRSLELDEERAVLGAEQQGIAVDRREDADPAVVFAPELLAE